MGVSHLPFDEAALAASVDQLLRTDFSPDSNFVDGYRQWQSAKGGIFTISVAQAIEIVFDTVMRTPR